MKKNFSNNIYVVDNYDNIVGTIKAYTHVSNKAFNTSYFENEITLMLCDENLLEFSKQEKIHKSLTIFTPSKNNLVIYKECSLTKSGLFISMKFNGASYGRYDKYSRLCIRYDRDQKIKKLIKKSTN